MSNVKIILVGDSAEGLKQAPLGMWYAKKMRADGGTHGLVRSFVPAEGVLFRVLLDDYTGDKCYIEAGTAPCPVIQYSGYLDAYSGVYDMDTAGGRAAAARRDAAEDTVERLVNNVDVHIPMMSGIRKVPAYDPSKDALPTLPPGSVLSSDTYPIVSVPRDAHDGDFRDLFTRYKPTRFTGLMRKVMQCTFGSGAWWGISYMGTSDTDPPFTLRKLKVNFQWNDSWGAVLAPGKDGSQGSHYFLIQIILNTVQWVPADFCVHKVKVDGVDAFAPVLKAVHSTKAIQIGTLPALGGTSCSNSVGWSFSYEEPKASAVIYGFVDQGQQSFFTTRLATIDFAFGSGVPGSIKCAVTEPQIVWTHLLTNDDSVFSFGTGVCNVPDDSGRYIITQDWHPIRTGPPSGAYECTNAPIHVYYSPGQTTPNLVTYFYKNYPATTRSRPAITKPSEYFSVGEGSESNDAYLVWGFSINGVGMPSGGAQTSSSYTDYTISGSCGAPAPVYNSNSPNPALSYGALYFDPVGCFDPHWVIPGSPPGSGSLYPSSLAVQWPTFQFRWVEACTKTKSGGLKTITSTCTLIADDVEAVILKQGENEAAVNRTTSYANSVGRDFYHVGSNAWTNGSGGVSGNADYQAIVAGGCTITNIVWTPFTIPSDDFTDPYKFLTGAQISYFSPFCYPVASGGICGVTVQLSVCGANYEATTIASAIPLATRVPTTDNTPSTDTVNTLTLYSHHDPIILEFSAWNHSLSQVHYLEERFTIRHTSSTFAPAKFYSYDKQVNKQVVVMGSEEYNPTNAVTGWIGVV